jgi:hypothetical protein
MIRMLLFDRLGPIYAATIVSCYVIRMLRSIVLGPIYAATKVSCYVIRMLRSIAWGLSMLLLKSAVT